jgi:hypothetical protein
MLTEQQKAIVLEKRQQMLDRACAVSGLSQEDLMFKYAVIPFSWNEDGEALSWAVVRIASLERLWSTEPSNENFNSFALALFPSEWGRQDILILNYSEDAGVLTEPNDLFPVEQTA